MTEIEFVPGIHGTRAVLRGAWRDQLAAAIRAQGCKEVELNSAKGWRGRDVQFLEMLPELLAVDILDFKLDTVEPIHCLHRLLALKVGTYCRTAIRFNEFPHLADCSLEWRPGCESLFSRTTLERLAIVHYDGKDLRTFSRLVGLERLVLMTAPLETLAGIEALTALRVLELAGMRKLRTLAGLERLRLLEELEIHTCRKIDSIEQVASLERLKRLAIPNNGDIASLHPIDTLRNLESVVFYESTNILDGDLTPLMHQEKLKSVAFQNRRHYSHRREDFPQWNAQVRDRSRGESI